MTKIGSIDFFVSSVIVDGYTGAGDFNTDEIDLKAFNGDWVLYLFSTHTVGSPSISIQSSPDNTNWVDYDAKSINIIIPNSIINNSFIPRYMRIVYTANSSNGFVTFNLNKVT